MGTATRKAKKAMAVRVNLSAIAASPDSSNAERAAARKAHKALDNAWQKRYSSNIRGFFSMRELRKTKAGL